MRSTPDLRRPLLEDVPVTLLSNLVWSRAPRLRSAAPWRLLMSAVALALLVPAGRASAQARDKDKDRDNEKAGVPREYLPPAGMCRVWIDGVPPTQQPAPTDCASAVRSRPANARVIYGEDKAKGKKVDDLPIKSLRGTDKKGPPLVPPNVFDGNSDNGQRVTRIPR